MTVDYSIVLTTYSLISPAARRTLGFLVQLIKRSLCWNVDRMRLEVGSVQKNHMGFEIVGGSIQWHEIVVQLGLVEVKDIDMTTNELGRPWSGP